MQKPSAENMSGYQKLPSEEQPDFAEKRLDDNKDEQQQRQQPSYQGAYIRAGMVTAVSLIVLCALSILCAGGFNHPALVHPTAFEKAARLERLQSDARQAARGLIKRNSLVQEAPESASPTFSSLTTTDQQGEPTTQSFVYTTRPIVNPGPSRRAEISTCLCERADTRSATIRRLHDRHHDWLRPDQADRHRLGDQLELT